MSEKFYDPNNWTRSKNVCELDPLTSLAGLNLFLGILIGLDSF